MKKIKTIINKEWAEVFKNRLVLFSVIFLPLILTLLPLLTVWGMTKFPDESGEPLPPELVGEMCSGLTSNECTMIYMLSIYTLMFMILPVMIPVTIAAYSIVGEKTTRSLEPLLATPITTIELLLGKALAAIIPAIVVSWLAYITYALITIAMLQSQAVVDFFQEPVWFMAIFIVGPLFTLLAVCMAILISSRVTDPRVAEQLSGLVILPVMLLVIGQSVGWLVISPEVIFLLAVGTAVVDAILIVITVKSFQREVILTRWK
jgi:ABC-2 type transport system permease protein